MNSPLQAPSQSELGQAESLSAATARYRRLISENTSSDPLDQLRLNRHHEWLKAAVPSLLGSASASLICQEWSASADGFLRQVFDNRFGDAQVALFAVGKLGSNELNLSSDVDLMLVSLQDDESHTASLRGFQKDLSELRPTGFVTRTDFDLRPGGRMGPMIPTVDHFLDYYGNYGETWERMALVRLRPITGSLEVIQQVQDFTVRFSYRKHLDYGLLDDLKALRAKIHAEHWKRSAGGMIDLKLGVGGIRDVELFIHALQVIHGGKDPELRVFSTTQAANRLQAKGLLPAGDATFLLDHYWRLRRVENYVQALNDEQTHRIDPHAKHPGFIQEELLDLHGRMARCSEIVAGLLGHPPPVPSNDVLKESAHDLMNDEELKELLQIPLLSRHRDRDEGLRKAFMQKFLEIVREQNANSRLAVSQLKDFLKSTRAKSSFFNLLLREEKLLREIAWLFGHSPYLGQILCYRPELLDAFVFRSQDLTDRGMELLLEDLVEKRLLGEIIEGGRFLRDSDVHHSSRSLSSTADGIVQTLTNALRAECPSQIAVLALGKWGGRELGFRSDLDFVMTVDGELSEHDHRFARRLISRLTEPHRGGSIYPIDLRLRPSGKAGPLVVDRQELRRYLREDSVPWERQAYLRARWIEDEAATLQAEIFQRPISKEDLQELNRIREGLVKTSSVFDLKYSEGGLVDLELFAQTLVLIDRQPLADLSTLHILENKGLSDLAALYKRLRTIEQTAQLVSSHSGARWENDPESVQHLAAALHLTSPALSDELSSLLERSRTSLQSLDPRRTSG